jgi:hypothetical protein
VSDTVWMRHPETGAVGEVPAGSLSMQRQSGWDLLGEDDVVERERAAAEDVEAAEAAMREKAAGALNQDDVLSVDDTRPEDELVQLGEEALASASADEATTADVLSAPTKDAGGRQTKKGNT